MGTLDTILTIGLIARITRLLVADRITNWWRAVWIVKAPTSPITYLLTCQWCTSVWVGAGVASAAYFWSSQPWWHYAALAGTASYLVGLSSNWLDGPTGDDQ